MMVDRRSVRRVDETVCRFREEPEGLAWGKLLIVHGLGEHAGRYRDLEVRWAKQGLVVEAWDLPGHGLSPGRRGDASSFDGWLEVVRRWIEGAVAGPALFVWGHSLGGNLVLNTLLLGAVAGLRGAIVTAPMLRTNHPIRFWKRMAAPVLARLWPTFTVASEIDPEDLSSLPESMAAFRADPLIHNRVSARLGHGMMERGERALAMAETWPEKTGGLPLLAIHGNADRLTSPEATRQFIAEARSGWTDASHPAYLSFVELAGIKHEPQWDQGAAEVLDRMRDWMRERV